MTVQSAAEFLAKVGEDNDLAVRLKDINTADELISFAQTKGYDFTQDELKKVKVTMESEELSEDDLEAIAGGGWWNPNSRYPGQDTMSAEQAQAVINGAKKVYRFVKSFW